MNLTFSSTVSERLQAVPLKPFFLHSRVVINNNGTITVKDIPDFQDKYKEEINIFLQCLYLLLYNKFIKHIKEEIKYPYEKGYLNVDTWQDYFSMYSPNCTENFDENGPFKSLDLSNHTYLHLISYLVHLIYHADEGPQDDFYTEISEFKFFQHIIKDLYFPSNVDIIVYEEIKKYTTIYAFDRNSVDIFSKQLGIHQMSPIHSGKFGTLYYVVKTLPIEWLQPYYPYPFIDFEQERKSIHINPMNNDFFSFFLSMCQEIDDFVESEGEKYPLSIGPVEYPVYNEEGHLIFTSFQPTMIFKTESVNFPFPLFKDEIPKFRLFWREYKRDVLDILRNIDKII